MIPYATCRVPLRVSAATVIPVCDHWNKILILRARQWVCLAMPLRCVRLCEESQNQAHSRHPAQRVTRFHTGSLPCGKLIQRETQ